MINRLQFSIDIKAEKTKIWKALWSESGYRNWASVFFEGSHVIATNWDVGSTVHFLSPNKRGIYSIIEKHTPNKIIHFKHQGNVEEGAEQPIDEKTKKWSGANEIYSLAEGENCHTLTIEIDIMDEHLDFMNLKLPLALEKIKSLAESQ